ncbi:NAD-dependent epimerase/dehydratase family protein [Paenarthrobacter sp. NyZ202]|uniref:NAD-dependent epimerase/dehydratase family protein n=1 Tax=Paenarthrobacter sp. NyZ202 TaxID=3402689 RepID=UPI003CF8D421
MARVIVTGGSGKLGTAVVNELTANNWEVINLDHAPPRGESPAPYIQVDFTDFGQTLESMLAIDEQYTGVDAVVHLAALPRPGLRPNAATFGNNFMSTYNVFAAARHAGINNIVWASSESVLGLPFDRVPPYIPLDENVARPETTYSLGKFLEEQMASVLTGRDPQLKMIALRLSHVMDVADYAPFPGFDDTPALRKFNLWSYVDARDAAQAVRKSLEYTGTGFEAFIIANADTVMSKPNDQLVAEFYPGVPYAPPEGANDTLLSIEKARRLLGYEPKHSWRNEV